jgi:hypothetical protein
LDRHGFVAYCDVLMMESAVFHRFVPLRIALTAVAIRFPLRRLSVYCRLVDSLWLTQTALLDSLDCRFILGYGVT